MYELIRLSLKDFRAEYKKYLVFEYLYLLLTGVLFVPLLGNLFNRVLRAIGASALLNTDVFRIILDWRGILGVLVVGVVAVIFVFIEFGVLIVISHKAHFGQRAALGEALLTVLRRVPGIIGFGTLHLLLFLLFLVPFVEIPLMPILTGDLNVPAFVFRRIADSPLMLAGYIAVLFALLYLFLRWMFTLHSMILEGKTIGKAIQESLLLTRGRNMLTALRLLALNLIVWGIGTGVLFGLTLLPQLIAGVVPSRFLENYLLTLSGFGVYMLSLLLTPLNIIFITRLYYRAGRRLYGPEQDGLLLVRSGLIERLERRIVFFFRRRKRLLALLLVANLILMFGVNAAVTEEMMHRGRRILVIGHRADSINAPENSLAAVRSAMDLGVDMVEIDIQKTADDHLVVFHDLSLTRVAGRAERVSEMTVEEITQVDIGSRFSPAFRGEPIPTLQQVLEETRGKVRVLIDVKVYGGARGTAEQLVTLLDEMDVREEVWIQSFDRTFLEEIRRLDPELHIGQIFFLAVGDLRALDVDFYAVEKDILTNRIVRQARMANRQVLVWTLNTEEEILEALRFDLDGIITNEPVRVRNLIDLSFPLPEGEWLEERAD